MVKKLWIALQNKQVLSRGYKILWPQKCSKFTKKQHSTLDAGLSTDFIFLITSYPPPATHLVTLVPHGA